MRLAVLILAVLCIGLYGAEAKKEKKTAKPKAAEAAVVSPVAKEIFGRQAKAAALAARSIGSYARGCLAGARALPVDGPAWQAMRLSRNRNWGHPALVAYVERLALDAKANDNWPGLLVGDMAQPMGGPMLTGHASHQIGLDADIWLTPMPADTLSPQERETRSAVSVLAEDGISVDPKIWTPEHVKLIKRAASYPEVARIFVHPAIKQALCVAADKDRGWLSKVRPWWGHHYHFHVRLSCPAGSQGCADQPDPGEEDGCGKEVESWLKRMKKPVVAQPEPPKPPVTPPKPKPGLTLADLPAECADLVGVERITRQEIVPGTEVPMPERKPEAMRKSAEKSG